MAGRVAGWLAGWPVGNCDYIAKLQLKLSLAITFGLVHLAQIWEGFDKGAATSGRLQTIMMCSTPGCQPLSWVTKFRNISRKCCKLFLNNTPEKLQ